MTVAGSNIGNYLLSLLKVSWLSAVLPYEFRGGSFEVYLQAKKSVVRAGQVRWEEIHATLSAEDISPLLRTTEPHFLCVVITVISIHALKRAPL
jgi:hypothetical protein